MWPGDLKPPNYPNGNFCGVRLFLQSRNEFSTENPVPLNGQTGIYSLKSFLFQISVQAHTNVIGDPRPARSGLPPKNNPKKYATVSGTVSHPFSPSGTQTVIFWGYVVINISADALISAIRVSILAIDGKLVQDKIFRLLVVECCEMIENAHCQYLKHI